MKLVYSTIIETTDKLYTSCTLKWTRDLDAQQDEFS